MPLASNSVDDVSIHEHSSHDYARMTSHDSTAGDVVSSALTWNRQGSKDADKSTIWILHYLSNWSAAAVERVVVD